MLNDNMKYIWQPLKNDEVKWIGVDFDDTIASNSSFPLYVPSEPLPGAVEALKKLNNMGYKITIFTARHWADYQNVENYCLHYGIPFRRIICGKPLFKCVIDDKNVAFKGDWEKAVEDCLKIK